MKYYRLLLLAASVLLAVTMIIVLYVPADSARLVGVVPDAAENAVSAYQYLKTGKFGLYLNGVFYPTRYVPWFQLTVLAPCMKLFGGDLFSATYALLFCSAATVIAAVCVLRKIDSFGVALLAVPAFLLYPEFQYYACHAMTESPYLLLMLCMLALYLNMAAKPGRIPLWKLILFALLTAWAGSFRTTACPMLLLPGILILCREGKLFGKAAKLFLLGLPSCLMLLATCLYHKSVFGSPFRTGYNFWLPIPHDFPDLLFHTRYLPANLQLLLHHEAFWLCVITGGMLFLLAYMFRNRSGKSEQDGTQFFLCKHAFLFAFCQFAILLAVYLPYYGTQDRYLHPAGVLFLIPLICLGSALLRTAFAKYDREKLALIFPVLAILFQYAVILHPQGDPNDVNVEFAEVESLRFCDENLPDNAVIITTYDPAMADFIFVRDTARRQLPAFRDIPYASYITSAQDTRPFLAHPGATALNDPMAAAPILEHGGILPFPHVMTDEAPALAQYYGSDWYLPEPAFSEGRIFVTNFSLLQMKQDRAERLKSHANLQSVAKNDVFELFRLLPLNSSASTADMQN